MGAGRLIQRPAQGFEPGSPAWKAGILPPRQLALPPNPLPGGLEMSNFPLSSFRLSRSPGIHSLRSRLCVTSVGALLAVSPTSGAPKPDLHSVSMMQRPGPAAVSGVAPGGRVQVHGVRRRGEPSRA